MFKIGDIVEITKESDATGMLDFKMGEGYEVINANSAGSVVRVINESGRTGWYHCMHFKLKEDTTVEKKECLFKEGQVVYDVLYGEGCVRSVANSGVFVVRVDFGHTNRWYNQEGVVESSPCQHVKRSLFFSPPVVTGATEPLFEPTLKKGDWVVLSDSIAQAIVKVVNETDTELFYEGDGAITFVNKDCVSVHRLGEKINFK